MKKNNIIIALFGESGSGKDTGVRLLTTKFKSLHHIIPTTTRPMRDTETNNVDYYFVDKEQFTKGVLNNNFYTVNCYNNWFYGINIDHTYELLMCCVQSEILNFIIQCKNIIFNNIQEGRCCVDCIYFNKELQTDEVKDKINNIRGNFDYRIFLNINDGKTSEKPVIYKTYKDLMTRKEKKNAKQREKRKAQKNTSI